MMCTRKGKLKHMRECKNGSCILTLVLDRRKWSTLQPVRFTPIEGAPGGH